MNPENIASFPRSLSTEMSSPPNGRNYVNLDSPSPSDQKNQEFVTPKVQPKSANTRNTRSANLVSEESPSDWKSHCTESLRNDTLLANELYLLAFAIGMQDAATFPDYHCFASNQTGNTVLLSVGVFGLGGDIFSITSIAMSLGLFIAGVITFGQLGNLFGVRKRWWLFVSSLVQTCLVFGAAALQYQLGVSESKDALGKVIISLLAFSSGVQVAMVRALKVTDITTAMATAAYVDIFIDPSVFGSWDNRPRNRRLFFLISLVAGSFAGAGSYKRMGSAFVLLISGVCKLAVTFLLLLNQRQEGGKKEIGV